MPETVNDKTVFSLFEVTKSIQKTLSERYKTSFWVKAEMNKLNLYPHSGHCYPELVEKKDGKIIAEIRANLWRDDYKRINTVFLNVLKEPLRDGINILFSARITYDPLFGLSLRILDIDPSYSLGQLEREKQETIEKIRKEGIYHANRSLKIALLPKRIAIISVETSKGYADFLKIMGGNAWGYSFFHMLFPALLQGEHSVTSILRQLKRIRKVRDHFDVVAIIRGGGGDVGLTCYNHYELAREIALFPIPVITGIGHSTNETVAEMVAFKNAITPTELADFLLQQFHNFAVPLKTSQDIIIDKSRRLLKEENITLLHYVRYFRSVTGSMLMKHNHEMQNSLKSVFQESVLLIKKEKERQVSMISRLQKDVPVLMQRNKQQTRQLVLDLQKDVVYSLQHATLMVDMQVKQTKKNSGQLMQSNRQTLGLIRTKLTDKSNESLKTKSRELESIEKNIMLMSPEHVLKRGYSITLLNGKVVKNCEQVKEGDLLSTILADGTITSLAKTIQKSEEI